MRGMPERQMAMLTTLSPEDLIPPDHPIRRIRKVVEENPEALRRHMSRFEHQLTPLHFAISRKRYDILDLLIELGADLEAEDRNGQTALAVAMLRGDREAMRRLHASDHAIAYGVTEPTFWLTARAAPAGAYGHVALKAAGKAAVDAAHAAGVAAGGRCDGAPGPRPRYGPRYYAAYLRDPDGLRLEVVAGSGP